MRFEMETDELNLVLFKISNQSIFFFDVISLSLL